MRKTTDYTNWDAADSDYLSGKARDKTLSTPGTKVNTSLIGDLWQTIWKAVRDSGITPNGNPDNETNDYQMHDALRISFNKNKSVLKDYVGGDITYILENDVDIVMLGCYVSGTPAITLPLTDEFIGKTARFYHHIGNGSLAIADFTNLTANILTSGITNVNWIDVYYDGSDWFATGLVGS